MRRREDSRTLVLTGSVVVLPGLFVRRRYHRKESSAGQGPDVRLWRRESVVWRRTRKEDGTLNLLCSH